MGNVIKKYQQEFCEFFGAKGAFAFWKGRVALYAMLKAIGIGPGDEVILPGYTCVMDVNPIKYLGAKPVYVDIEPKTFNVAPELLEEKITDKTKAVIVQHTYGYMCEMDAVMEIAERNGVQIVEDCCLSLGSKYKGKMAGTFGRAAYFSFQWNKPYTTGLGGMVLLNDSGLCDRIKALCDSEMCLPNRKEAAMLWAQLVIYRVFVYPRTTAFAQTVFRYFTKKGVVVGSSSTSEFKPTMARDFFKGMCGVQVRSGFRQLEKLGKNIAHRKVIAQLYDELLSGKGWPIRQYDESVMEPVMVRYPVRVRQKNEVLSEAAKAGVELGSWFESPLHPIETPLEKYDYKIGMCPEAEKASRETVNLPVHPRVSERTVRRTVNFITEFAQPA